MAKAQVRGRSKTITFVYMHVGAKHLLSLAEASRDGQLYTVMSALMYCAFTLEAYINHLGALRHADWEAKEHRKSAKDKFKMLAREVGVQVNFGKPPYRTMRDLFAFRDKVAHGRTTREKVDKLIKLDGPHLPQIAGDTEWLAFATIENARQAVKDVEAMVKELHKASGFTGSPFASSGGGFYAVTRA
jgi:hypothetical protein